jgi:hypothetical protein
MAAGLSNGTVYIVDCNTASITKQISNYYYIGEVHSEYSKRRRVFLSKGIKLLEEKLEPI